MSVSITIHPSSDRLIMYGEPDAGSAYSLSGYIEISLSYPFSFFARRRPVCFHLHSLVLTFEGQCEIASSQTGYSAVRLCSITQELVTDGPIELDNTGYEELDEPCRWRIVFDLNVPGWLPTTSSFGSEQDLGNHYALYASAQYTIPEEGLISDWPLLSICLPWFSRSRVSQAVHDVIVDRLANSPHPDRSPHLNSCLAYLVTNITASKDLFDVVSKIQILASVPDYVDINSNQIPLTLRIRTKGLPHEVCEDLRALSFDIDFLQTESISSLPSEVYESLLPPKSHQPPNLPLRRPHPIATVYDLGLDPIITPPDSHRTLHYQHSFLPSPDSGHYTLAGDNTICTNDADVSGPSWLTVDVNVPFTARGVQKGYPQDGTRPYAIGPSASSPLFVTQHSLSIALKCSYIAQGNNPTTEIFRFSVPIHLARFPSKTTPQESARFDTSSMEGPFVLPPYSRLFHHNGEQRIDYSVPLPLYTPLPPTSPPYLEHERITKEFVTTNTQQEADSFC